LGDDCRYGRRRAAYDRDGGTDGGLPRAAGSECLGELALVSRAEELALRTIADGTIDVRPWLSVRIGLGAVADAVAQMSGPLAPVRSLVDPRRP